MHRARGQARERRRHPRRRRREKRRSRLAEPRPRGALTWARAASRGHGLLPGASVLLAALPLAFAFSALRHLAREVHALRGRLPAKATRDKFGSEGWDRLREKFVPGVEAGQRPGRGARGAGGERLLSPAGSAGTQRAVRATWDWRALRPAVARARGVAPAGAPLGSPRFPPRSAPVAASVRRARSPRRERRLPSGPRSHRLGSRRRSAPALRASPEFRQVGGGNSSPALFQLPHRHPPAGWTLAPPSRPPLASPPPSSPPHPHPEARTRHREEPGLGAPGRSPFPSPSPAGRGAARGAAAGHPRQRSLEAARSRRGGARGNRGARPWEILIPGKGRGGSRSSRPFPARQRPGGLVPALQSRENYWSQKFAALTPARQIKAWNPWEGKERLLFFPLEFGFRSFLTFVKNPTRTQGKEKLLGGKGTE